MLNRSHTYAIAFALAFLSLVPTLSVAGERGIVEDPASDNTALLVGVAHGLPGIDLDLNNAGKITSHASYKFQTPKILQNQEGKIDAVREALTEGADNAGGTFFFYYSGHGSRGSIYLQNGNFSGSQIASAIRAGRTTQGPLDRLVIFFDSCFSGSLLDPMRNLSGLAGVGVLERVAAEERDTRETLDVLTDALTPTRGEGEYWKSLFVFASSRANESSLAGSAGSAFTVAMASSFQETLDEKGTLGSFVTKTQSNTHGHHPMVRFVPETLADESLEN